MAKSKTNYTCTECGGVSNKWAGQCPNCAKWNTLVETVVDVGAHRFATQPQGLVQGAPVQKLSQIAAADVPRVPTGIEEFDRVLGGGLVAGGVVLIGGDPGIGKSTLLLQALSNLSKNSKALYVSGEESGAQVALRARRLQIDANDLHLQAEIQLEKILNTLAEQRPQVAVVDSIQTLYSDALTSAPGSVAQVRECAAQLTRVAKQSGITIIMVGHVTKEGALAGPRVLEHIVDTVLYFEGDTHSSFRLVRAFKNRFGAVNELGVFAMTEKGLKGVSNPSALFLSQHDAQVPGSCVMVTQEGTRPLLVEVQALVAATSSSAPRRATQGVDSARIAMLLAVLERRVGARLADREVYVSTVGGVRITEPASDLAVALAVASASWQQPLPPGTVAFGEVGLAGEIRNVVGVEKRLAEASRLGMRRAIVPAGTSAVAATTASGLVVVPANDVRDALAAVRTAD